MSANDGEKKTWKKSFKNYFIMSNNENLKFTVLISFN